MAYKHDYDKILTRLISILSKLNDGEELKVSDLAVEFNVSQKTISRDFDRLSSFPIYKDGKCWKMQEGFKIEKSSSLEEQISLDILESMAKGTGGKFSQTAIKAIGKLKNQTQNPIYAKLHMEDISSHIDMLGTIEKAIKDHTIISCSYNKPDLLELEPLKVTNYEGFWYLVAYDKKDEVLKKYYLKSLKNISLTDKIFTPRSKIQQLLDNSISIWFDETTKPYEVRLFVDAKVAKYFIRKSFSSTQTIIGEDRDGSLEVSIYITNDMEILPIIKYWLPHIKVIEPQSLAEKVKSDLEEYLADVAEIV